MCCMEGGYHISLTDNLTMDWTGNKASMFAAHGATNHSSGGRIARDFYATDPQMVEKLLQKEEFNRDTGILEPCCGNGHISEVLKAHGYKVASWDIVRREYDDQLLERDFLEYFPQCRNEMDIVTNPPYRDACKFVRHALDISYCGVKVAMLLKLSFLEGRGRKSLMDLYPPKQIYVFRNRIDCWPNGIKPAKPSKGVCYAWFVWERGWYGSPAIDWID